MATSPDLPDIEKRLPMMLPSAMKAIIAQLVAYIRQLWADDLRLKAEIRDLKAQVRRLENEKQKRTAEEDVNDKHRWPKPVPHKYYLHDKG